MEIMLLDVLGKPAWMWVLFLCVVIALVVFDLGLLHRRPREIGIAESLTLSAFYIGLALGFGAWVWWELGQKAGVEYLTGFLIEKSLAMDNVFVIALIFGYFGIPRIYQHRALLYGIVGVLILRGIVIGAGVAMISNFEWVLYLFALFLVFTGIKMLSVPEQHYDVGANPVLRLLRRHLRVSSQSHDHAFFSRETDPVTGKSVIWATPLFLALMMIEFADLVFAIDSIPAIFAVTTDPYIVYTSNIFAVLGLRALYFALAAMMHRFVYLRYALATILIFIGAKVFVADLIGIDKVPAIASLTVTVLLLATGLLASFWKRRQDAAGGRP